MMKKMIMPILMALMMIPFGALAQTGVQNYVSASGYVIMNVPFYHTGEDGYAFDFEADYDEGRLVSWTTIDADGDSYNWTLSPIGEGFGRQGSNGVMLSYSYSNYSGVLHPDNYLVSPKLTITDNNHFVTFYACALDEAYPAEHFGLAVSTTASNNPSAFTMLQEWTMTAKSALKADTRDANGTRQGNWHEYMVDLGDYVGQDVYLAIRHFNSSDNFCLCVDDVFVGPQTKDPLQRCSIALDGTTLEDNFRGTHYLQNTDGFADGSTHTTSVTATYQSGACMTKTTEWTYRSSDHFTGSPTGLHATSDGSTVNLSWSLPMMTAPFQVEELFYDFADSTFSDLTLIDANHDGYNFRIYPYGGYGSGNCIKSDSWIGGNNVNPDNYVVLPRVTATENTVFSFMAVDSDMPGIAPDPEHFGVAVSTSGNTNPSDFTMVQEWNSTGDYTEYSVDLSAYAGQQIYVAIRHFNTTGETYYLYVDNIKITAIEAEVSRPAKGALVYANGELVANLHHGETSFTHMVNRYNSEYCIRVIQEGSREDGTYYALASPQCADVELDCVAPKNLAAEYDGDKVVLTWEREIFTGFEEDPQGWTFLDADGDGYVFGIYAAGGMDPDGSVNTAGTNASLTSFSYANGYGELHPDNYAFMPRVKALEGAKMEFYAAGFDPNFATEHFGVVVASSDGTQISTIAEYDTRNPYQRFEVDLSAYAGQEVYLGFRHFNTTPNYALCIDNITVTNVVWAGTASETYGYYVYRSTDGQDYGLIGVVTGSAMHFDDNDISSETFYYQVTAINTIVGGECESAPAVAVDGIYNYVTVTTDGLEEVENGVNVYPNPTHGNVTIEAEGLNRVVVMNALGQTLSDMDVDADSVVLDLSQYGVGLYVIRVESEAGTIAKRVFVVR